MLCFCYFLRYEKEKSKILIYVFLLNFEILNLSNKVKFNLKNDLKSEYFWLIFKVLMIFMLFLHEF